MLKKAIQRYAVAFGMAAAMFAAGAGGIQRANAAEIADQAGSVQESETVRQSETPQESEMQRQPETIQQSETTGQSETLPLKNVKNAPKLSGKWVKQHGKVRFLSQDKTYATKTWANIKGRYYYFDKTVSAARGCSAIAMERRTILAKRERWSPDGRRSESTGTISAKTVP